MLKLKVILVSPNAGDMAGGEAIKALYYFHYLISNGVDAHLVTHARSRKWLGELSENQRVHFIEDGPIQVALWKLRVISRLVHPVFHILAARFIRDRFDLSTSVVHYLCPISPVEPRFPPRHATYVLGPLNAAAPWPSAFQTEEGRGARIERALTGPIQTFLRLVGGEKALAQAVLVSGGAETEASLRMAGAKAERIFHVVDSGVSEKFYTQMAQHHDYNGRFIAIGRFVPYKGFDLALEALARTPDDITLDLYGGGVERSRLEALSANLGLGARAKFGGWLSNDAFAERIREYRALVFPSLAEANGIVMQEAMAAGIPVIALRWGGPARLADDASAVFVEPSEREAVIDGFATEMTALAADHSRAAEIAAAAREVAESEFRWEAVASSWAQAYSASELRGASVVF